jgi:hypothetical protein
MRLYCGVVHSGALLLEGTLPSAGNGRALACSSRVTSCGVISECTDRTSAAAAATRGAERLVPTEVL